MTAKYVLSVGYDQPRLDFRTILKELPTVLVKRTGPQRRVQIELPEDQEDAVRALLPENVRIELVQSYSTYSPAISGI